MNKQRYAVWTSMAVAASLLLTGCQSLTGYKQIDKADSAKVRAGNIQPVAGEVNISCLGTYHCEIVQIDKTLVIAPDTHEPVSPDMLVTMPVIEGDKSAQEQMSIDMAPLLNNNAVKIVPLSKSGMPGLTNYYARVKPAKREVQVNFYPENNVGYVERFAIIHDFVEPGTYQLRAYQKKSSDNSGSLLDTASPEPLCIELSQDKSLQRRFCKQLGAEHQGEFVETSIVEQKSTQAKTVA
ncbi:MULTISPECIES: hypothetical protein [Psychrobacter]|jgi:hypothetical protein|uniref:hypothetical protein n=1 Tax=Psychrobacter TaxID=497 RepID=UPI00041F2D84|nr:MULTISPECIES: hypothetical protein [Psychrobacter]NRD71326.1 hypothetical protein [Psychrobacter okhotskensis]